MYQIKPTAASMHRTANVLLVSLTVLVQLPHLLSQATVGYDKCLYGNCSNESGKNCIQNLEKIIVQQRAQMVQNEQRQSLEMNALRGRFDSAISCRELPLKFLILVKI